MVHQGYSLIRKQNFEENCSCSFKYFWLG